MEELATGVDGLLRSLRAVTDTALERLDVDDLLNERLSRVQVILSADTAVVLLLEPGSGDLVARAARGLEEEARQAFHVPLGGGFSGRIASLRRRMILDRVDLTTVSNPLLVERGIQVLLGVPLLAGGELLGVLNVGRKERRPFTEEDADLLEVVAVRVAGALQARERAVGRAAIALLERSLLPDRLPDCPGLEFATRYLTPEEPIGGDWYDVFTLPSGQLWVVTGDVAGHGMRAAVVMGRVRSTLRAYALLGVGPAEALELTSRKVEHFEIAMATALCATSDFPYTEFELASVGHPPPVIARPGEKAALVELDPSPPLGLNVGRPRTSTTLSLPNQAVLLLYTDGLVERRGEHLDVGFERLRATVEATDPETVCRQVSRRLIGRGVPDDVAMVAVRRNDALRGRDGA